MHGNPANTLLQHIHLLTASHVGEDFSDRQLLERLVSKQDEAAFTVLVERHGPMVLGVCRRILHDEHLAEDAFQATFLVLARQARSIRKAPSIGSWLHGVALRLSRKAKTRARRQAQPDVRCRTREPIDVSGDVTWREMRQILDAELQQLPDKYRLPLILCYLEGKTRDEAALQLGWTVGQLKGLLERGRERLCSRLKRRGVSLSAAVAASLLAEGGWASVTPPLLAVSTIQACARFMKGQPVVDGGISPAAFSLAQEGSGIMSAKFKKVLALLLVICTVGVGVTLWFHEFATNSAEAQPVTSPERDQESRGESAREKEPTPIPPAKAPNVAWHLEHIAPKASSIKIDVEPAAKVIRTPNGLRLPVTITNHSTQDITTKLAYESGEAWPPLYASVTQEGAMREKPFRPVFLFGKRPEKSPPIITIPKGGSATLDVRIDLAADSHGAVSPPMFPALPGQYTIRLLLVFDVDERREYVTSAPKRVELPSTPKEIVNGLSAKIVIKSKLPLEVIPGEKDMFAAELVLTNESNKPIPLCTWVGRGGGGCWVGGGETGFGVNGPARDTPLPFDPAKDIAMINPGKSYSFPLRMYVQPVDGQFTFSSGYSVGKEFGKEHNVWFGSLRVDVVIPVIETKRVILEDERKLQGTWRVTSQKIDGVRYGEGRPELNDGKAIIVDNNFTEVDKHRRNPMTFKLDPATKPKTIRFKSSGVEFPGIYELSGNRLRLCLVREADAKTPSDFTAPAGSHRWSYTFERQPPKDPMEK